MRFEILNEKQNPLMKRKELIVNLDYEGGATPSKQALSELLSKEINSTSEKIDISKIQSELGRSRGKAWIKVYEDKVTEKKTKKKAEQKQEAK